jgi:hypothetical protein
MITRILTALTSMAVVMAATAVPANASPQMVKQAKDASSPAQNCQYCHSSAIPKKDTFRPEDLNERGKFLLIEKEKQNAKQVKVEWLKSYPGAK